MKRLSNTTAALFATGFLQVIFVAANTVFITQFQLVHATITSFLISMIWTFNVKRIAFGGMADRYAYASGAALGCLAGILAATTLVGGAT